MSLHLHNKLPQLTSTTSFMTKTYAQIAREIAALQATAAKLYALEVKEAVTEVNAAIAEYNLSATDLRFPATHASTKQPMKGKLIKASAKAVVATAEGAKYSDGKGHMWGGRGPRPGWLRSAVAAGHSLESFLKRGEGASLSVQVKSTSKSFVNASASNAPSLSAPKYLDPKTGVTWSGRGPRPRWLKAALRKRGSVIEHLLIGAVAPVEAAVPLVASAPATAKRANPQKASSKKIVKSGASSPGPVAVSPAPKKTSNEATPKKIAAKRAVKAPIVGRTPVKKVMAHAVPAVTNSLQAKSPPNSSAVTVPTKKVRQAKEPALEAVVQLPTTQERKPVSPKQTSASASKPAIPNTKAKKTVPLVPTVPLAVVPTLDEPLISST